MEHKILFKDGVAYTLVSGKAIPEGFARVVSALVASPEWEPGMTILAEYSELDLSHLSTKGMESLAHAVSPYRTALGSGNCLIVSAQALNYGMGKAWEVYMKQYSDLKVGVYYSIEDAEKEV
jgi:hypothetical protein